MMKFDGSKLMATHNVLGALIAESASEQTKKLFMEHGFRDVTMVMEEIEYITAINPAEVLFSAVTGMFYTDPRDENYYCARLRVGGTASVDCGIIIRTVAREDNEGDIWEMNGYDYIGEVKIN